MTLKSVMFAVLATPVLATTVLAGGFDLSTPEKAVICGAKANDLIAVGMVDEANAMGCYTDDAVLNVYAPGVAEPIMSSSTAPNLSMFLQGVFGQFDYAMTQHLTGNIVVGGDKVHSSVHATHVRKDGKVDIANAEWTDTVVKVGSEYKVAKRDATVVMFGTYEPTPVLGQ